MSTHMLIACTYRSCIERRLVLIRGMQQGRGVESTPERLGTLLSLHQFLATSPTDTSCTVTGRQILTVQCCTVQYSVESTYTVQNSTQN